MMLIKRHFQSLSPLQRHLCSIMQFVLVLALVDMVTGAQMCTKAVPVQRDKESRKVHVLRRVPATCSNWEKAWSWITKKDCGTKYRLDLVDLPSDNVITYKLAKVCCDGDTQCKEAQEAAHESGANVTDDKFLAIVLGSTAAALVLLILVVGVSLCHRKKQCSLLCEEQRHVYASAEEADDCSEGEEHKACQPSDDETENKVTESEYAEINDTGLPRYTDIFKEPAGPEGPFTRASAPPLPSYEAGRERHVHFETHECSARDLLLQSGAARQVEAELDQPEAAAAAPRAEGGEKGEVTLADTSYYNLGKQKPVKDSAREEVVLNHHVIPGERVIVLNGAPAASAVGCTCGGGGGGGGDGSGGGGDGVAKPASSQGARSAGKDKRSSATYDRLEEPTELDQHEYQRLNSNSSRGHVTSAPTSRLTSSSASNHSVSAAVSPTTKAPPSPIPTEDASEDEEEESDDEEKGEEEESAKIVLSSSGSAGPLSVNGHIETAATC